jgi:hypothetical protein
MWQIVGRLPDCRRGRLLHSHENGLLIAMTGARKAVHRYDRRSPLQETLIKENSEERTFNYLS